MAYPSRFAFAVGGGGIANEDEAEAEGWTTTRSISTLCPVGAFLFVIGVKEGDGDGMYVFDLIIPRLSCLLLLPATADAELDSLEDDDFLFFGFGSTSSKLGLK